MRPTPCCPSWVREPRWPSRTPLFSPARFHAGRKTLRPHCKPMRSQDAPAPRRFSSRLAIKVGSSMEVRSNRPLWMPTGFMSTTRRIRPCRYRWQHMLDKNALAPRQHDQRVERHAAFGQRREWVNVDRQDDIRAIDRKLPQSDERVDDGANVARLAAAIALDQPGRA